MTDKPPEQLLKEIRDTLEEMRSILILANQENLEKAKKRLLPKGSVKEKVYDLCDGSKTSSDVAQALGKDSSYVRSYLSILRKDGLIRTTKNEGQTTYEQII